MRLFAAIGLVVLVGCGAGDETTEPDEMTTTVPDLPGGLETGTFLDIVSDAGDRAGVPETDVELVSIEMEEFNDASLGCPEEGQMYAQVITPGFRVLVSAAGVEYDYRVAEGDDSFRLCEVPN